MPRKSWKKKSTGEYCLLDKYLILNIITWTIILLVGNFCIGEFTHLKKIFYIALTFTFCFENYLTNKRLVKLNELYKIEQNLY